MPSPDTTTAANELHVIADTIERHRDRVAAVAEPFLGTEREDVVTAVHEAERQLLMASRALQRAIKTIPRSPEGPSTQSCPEGGFRTAPKPGGGNLVPAPYTGVRTKSRTLRDVIRCNTTEVGG